MRKLLCFLILLPFSALACIQHINIRANDNGYIYFTYAKLQNIYYQTPSHNVAYYSINPITCVFSTKYQGKIIFHPDNTNMKNPTIPIKVTISKNQPYTHTFSSQIGISTPASINIANDGCNSGVDGDKCIVAKQLHLDNLDINCH